MAFDERDAARAGISYLTGETVRTNATSDDESYGDAVSPSIMSEAGDGTVELLVPVLGSDYPKQHEARRFMVSPLGCLVQFTHSLLAQVNRAA